MPCEFFSYSSVKVALWYLLTSAFYPSNLSTRYFYSGGSKWPFISKPILERSRKEKADSIGEIWRLPWKVWVSGLVVSGLYMWHASYLSWYLALAGGTSLIYCCFFQVSRACMSSYLLENWQGFLWTVSYNETLFDKLICLRS